MKNSILTLVVFLAMCLVTASTASASLVSLHVTGVLGNGTYLGATPLADNTPFSYTATFNANMSTLVQVDSLTFDITGYGTYHMKPGAAVWAIVRDKPFWWSFYETGIYSGGTSWYNAFTVTYNNSTPTNWVYTEPFNSVTFNNMYAPNSGDSRNIIPFSESDLSLINPTWGSATFSDSAPTAEFTASAVPEPSTYALFAMGFGGLAFWKRRQVKACSYRDNPIAGRGASW